MSEIEKTFLFNTQWSILLWTKSDSICVYVYVLSGGVIREDSAYSIAAVPTSAARCPRCRRYTADSADCLCPRCQTVVSQAN